MKILLVITGLGRGGAERQVCDLADRFTALGHEVRILYLIGEALIRPKSSTVSVVALGLEYRIGSLAGTTVRLCRAIRAFAPDIVHSHMVHANLLTRLARLFVSMPKLICTAHNANEGGRLRMLLYRLSAPLADHSTNVSQEAVDAFIAKGATAEGKMSVMYNGIDTKRFKCNTELRFQTRLALGVQASDPVLLCVGRLDMQKNYPMMLYAFAKALRTQGNLQLYIAGEGPLHGELEQLCRTLRIEHRVRFLGFRTDTHALMCAADLFCLSSDFEGFGLVIAEAMACELPVVATDCGGVKEVLGGFGLLSKIGDAEAFAQNILHALGLSEEAKHALTSQTASRARTHFDIDRIAQAWIRLYENT